MTIDKAIQEHIGSAKMCEAYEVGSPMYEIGKEERQVAEWLEDYKRLKEHFDSLPDWLPVWVSCDEAMPDSEERCLVFTKGHNIGISRRMGRNLRGEWTCCGYEVTHWMPLPEPPKEG